jgi:hypothetical protein
MRKQTRRKVYRLVNPISYAIEGATITPEDILDKLRQRELTSIEAFRMGQADLADWQMINDMANLCEVMAKSGIGPEALEAAERTHEYLLEAYHRYNKTKKMGTSGLGLVAFRDCYEYHDLQRQSISRSVYEQMLTKTMNQIRSKSPDVLELK